MKKKLNYVLISINLENGGGGSDVNSRKRRLDLGSSAVGGKPENELWNEVHVTIVRDLEKRGTLWRFSSKHLKVWTDEIVDGNSAGVNEEPDWDKHIEAVTVPPKSRRSVSPKEQKSTAGINNALEMFQSTLMMMMAAQASTTFQASGKCSVRQFIYSKMAVNY